MKTISLTKGYNTLVDDDDYDELSKYKWSTDYNNDHCIYAFRTVNKRSIRMHQHIMGTANLKGIIVDHKNGNGLDNQKINLRIATKQQNAFNSRPKTYLPKGVTKLSRLRTRPFQARIAINGQQIHLGYYSTQYDAANAYNIAAQRYFGEFAKSNILCVGGA
jgi:hypothetical protein